MFGLPSLRVGRCSASRSRSTPRGSSCSSSWPRRSRSATSRRCCRRRPPWEHVLVGVVTTLLFFASVVAHEFSHSLVAKAQGARIARITLFIFGGVSQMEDEPDTPGTRVRDGGRRARRCRSCSPAVFFLGFVALSVLRGPDAVAVRRCSTSRSSTSPSASSTCCRASRWTAAACCARSCGASTHDLLKATRWASRTGQAHRLPAHHRRASSASCCRRTPSGSSGSSSSAGSWRASPTPRTSSSS